MTDAPLAGIGISSQIHENAWISPMETAFCSPKGKLTHKIIKPGNFFSPLLSDDLVNFKKLFMMCTLRNAYNSTDGIISWCLDSIKKGYWIKHQASQKLLIN